MIFLYLTAALLVAAGASWLIEQALHRAKAKAFKDGANYVRKRARPFLLNCSATSHRHLKEVLTIDDE